MTEAQRPLEGMHFFASPRVPLPDNLQGTPRGERWVESWDVRDIIVEEARALGATVLRDTGAIPPDVSPWMLHAGGRTPSSGGLVEAGLMQDTGRPFGVVPTQPFVETDIAELEAQLRAGRPFMLSYRKTARGIGKYLIEQPVQLDTFRDFLDAHPEIDSGVDYGKAFHVRPYIETPSDHFTSYRLLVAATGLIAAGVNYSEAPKDQTGIARSERDQVAERPHLARLAETLENETSPFYLAARDVRSIQGAGFGTIPLMGGKASRPINNKERMILEALGIDPANPAVPPKLVTHADWIGSTYGPEIDLLTGPDFLQPAHLTDEYLYLELNPGPGPSVYNHCWLRGEETNASAVILAMRRAGLRSVVNMRERQKRLAE